MLECPFSTDLLVLDDGVVDDVSPEVGEHEGAGHQEMKDCDLDFSDGEGKTEVMILKTHICDLNYCEI